MELSQTERNTHLPLSASTSPTVEVMQSFISRAWVTKVLLLPANRQRKGHLERSEDTDASKERGEQCRGEVRILKDLAERNTRAEHYTIALTLPKRLRDSLRIEKEERLLEHMAKRERDKEKAGLCTYFE